MRRLYTTVLFIAVINLVGYSQIESDKTIFKSVELNQIESIEINITSYSLNQIGALKDDLISFDEKVISVHLDEGARILQFTYNDKMLLEDLIKVFEKNNVNYLLEPKGTKINTKTEGL